MTSLSVGFGFPPEAAVDEMTLHPALLPPPSPSVSVFPPEAEADGMTLHPALFALEGTFHYSSGQLETFLYSSGLWEETSPLETAPAS